MRKNVLVSTFSRCFFGKESMVTNAKNTKGNNCSGWKQLSLLLLFSVMMVGSSWAQSAVALTTAGNGTWVCPLGVTSVQVECWGAGGGGGGTAATYNQGGGGAGGSYVKYTVTVTPGTTYNYTVGAGGTAGAAGGASAGGTGGSSFFGNSVAGTGSDASILATGGAGGAGSSASGGTTGARTGGAAGGTGSTTGNLPSSGATTNTAGTSGGTSVGGASGTAHSGAGGAAPNGSITGGAGAAQVTSSGSSTAGTNGTAPGGGASGSSSVTLTKAGGVGGTGEVILTYTVPTPSSQPSGLSFSGESASTITVNFTPVSGTYTLIVAYPSTVSTPTSPTNGTVYATAAYTSGTSLGTGANKGYVVYSGSASSATITGLSQNTTYNFYLYSFYGYSSTNNYPVYYTTSPTNGSDATTNPVLPTAQPTTLTATPSSTGTSYTFTWVNPTGTGPNTLIVMYPHGATRTDPSATTYTSTGVYGSSGGGSSLGSGGNTGYVVYNGASSTASATVTGLTAQTAYDVYLYSFNATLYLTTSPLTNSSALYTYSAPPSAVGATLSLAEATSTTANITLGTAATYPSSGATKAGYLIVYSTGTPALVSSPNGLAPASAVGTGSYTTVTETSAPTAPTINGTSLTLTAGTAYNVLVVPYTWDGSNTGTYNYLKTSAPTASVTIYSNLATWFNSTATTSTASTIGSNFTASYANAGYAYLGVNNPNSITGTPAGSLQFATQAFGGVLFEGEGTTTTTATGFTGVTYSGTVSGVTAGATNTRYIDFKVTPSAGYTFNVSSLSMQVQSMGTSTSMTCAVAYSTDGVNFTEISSSTNVSATNTVTFSNTYDVTFSTAGTASTGTVATIALSGQSISVPDGSTLTFRVIAWRKASSTASATYMNITNVVIGGSATAVPTPTAQPTSFNTSSLTGGTVTLGWTNGAGTGTNTLVEVYPHYVSGNSGSTNSATAPTGGTTYSASGTYTSGAALGSGYVVYKSTGNSVALTGLSSSTQYDVALYSFNPLSAYYTTSPLTGTFTTLATPTITSALTDVAYSAVSYSYQITATSPTTPAVSSYSSSTSFTGALSGLSLNTSTGVLSGTVTTTGTYNIDIEAANANGSTAATLVLTVSALPTPTLTSLSQTSSLTGSSGFTLTVTGTNFVNNGSTVTWAGSNRTTTYVSSTQLTASITGSDLSSAGTYAVGITNANGTNTYSSSTINYSVSNSVSVPITTIGTGTWTCPAGVTAITVETWGAGAAGGGMTSTQTYNNGSGGGSGSYIKANLVVTPGVTYNLNVGAGGAASSSNTGNAGGSTYFGNTSSGSSTGAVVLATGGAGGVAGSAAGSSSVRQGPFTGGAGGLSTNNVVPSSGVSTNGNAGGNTIGTTIATTALGGSVSGIGGTAPTGSISGGTGGTAVNSEDPTAGTKAGIAGTQPGGGGSGASNRTATGTSGAGGAGEIVITYSVLPTITSAFTATGVEQTAFSYTINATNATSYSYSGTLPAGLSYSSGVISGTVTAGDAASSPYSITINATNTYGTSSATLVITITNQTPVINSSLTTINGLIGTAISNYSITATNMGSTPNGYSASGLPAGLTCDPDGTIHGTPTATGTFNATLTATNALTNGTATLTFVIASSVITPITTAGSGTWTCPAGVTAITIETWGAGGYGGGITENSSNQYTNAGGGAAGSYVTANISVTPGTVYNLNVGVAGSAVYGTGSTGGSSYFGNTSSGSSTGAVILATGGAGGTAGTGLGTTAAETGGFAGGVGSTTGNIVPSNGTTIAGASGGTSLAGAQGTAHSGAGGAAPTGSISGGAGGAAVVSTSAGSKPGNAGTQPGGGGSGESDVTLSEYGGAGGTGEIIISYSALPVITSAGTASGIVGSSFSYSIVASGTPTSYTVTGTLPSGVTLDASTGIISSSGVLTTGTGGTYPVTIYASNGYGAGASITLTITIIEKPTITSALALTLSENTAMSTYTITATQSPTSYSESGTLPTGLTFTAGTGTITGTPTVTGTFSVTISATNAAGTTNATLTITVDARPGITSALTASDTIGHYFAYTITASQSPTSYNASGLPTGLIYFNGVISGTPTVYGTYNVALSATNATGTGTATLVLTIDSSYNYYYNGGALTSTSNWSTAPNGGGVTAPSTAFTQTGVAFNILTNATTASNSGTWTIGTTSHINVGSSTVSNVTLTIDASHPLASTDSVDIKGANTVSIANTTIPLLHTLATTSTVVFNGNTTQSIPITPTYGNLTISNSGSGITIATLAAGTIIINGNLTVNSGDTLTGTTGTSIIQVNGNAYIYGIVNLHTASAGYFTGTGNFYLEAGATLMNGYNGGISLSPATTYAIRNTGSRNFDPAANYVIQPDASGNLGAGFPSQCANLTIFPTKSSLTMTLSQALTVTGSLVVDSGTLATGGFLTLKSSSITNSAIVAKVCASCAITGNATVERYIPSTWRAFRDLGAAGVYASGNTIYNTWQESGSYSHSGYGLFITGVTSTAGSSYSSNHVDNGGGGTYLDYSLNSYPSAYYWSTATQAWDTVKNTNTTALNPFQSYRILVRGDRGFDLYTSQILNYPNGLRMYDATALRTTGSLIYGPVTYSSTGVTNSVTGSAYTSSTYGLSSAASGYSYITNPYDCPIDYHNIYSNGRIANMIYGYWYLDPTVAATGSYVAYNAVANVTNIGYSNGNFIQAGQGFLVANYNVDGTHLPSIQITEADKSATTSSRTSVFGAEAPTSKLFVGLLKNATRVDGVAVVFGNKFSNGIGLEDSRKLSTGTDNLSIKEGSDYLSIDGRLPATASDVLSLQIAQPSTTSYQLRVDASGYINEGYAPLLYDAYKNTTTALSGVDTVEFTVDAKTTASYANRFSIIFTPSALAVNSIVASATLNNKIATITWNTVGEKGESRFEVEKSIDGRNFASIAHQAAKNTATASYSTTDNSVAEGNNYYRIKAVSETGSVAYSNIAKLTTNNSQLTTIYPNPLVGKTLNVSLGNVAAGKYVVSIYNALGQKVNEQTISHSGGSAIHALVINNTLAGGIYSVVIRAEGSNQIVHQTSLSVQP